MKYHPEYLPQRPYSFGFWLSEQIEAEIFHYRLSILNIFFPWVNKNVTKSQGISQNKIGDLPFVSL